ncbi:hypothetical protein C0991_009219, partial [Blastosporella zonata]
MTADQLPLALAPVLLAAVRALRREDYQSVGSTVLEHGSDEHRAQTLRHLLDGLLDFATSEQGAKSVTKALKEGGKPTLDRIVERMCEAANG